MLPGTARFVVTALGMRPNGIHWKHAARSKTTQTGLDNENLEDLENPRDQTGRK